MYTAQKLALAIAPLLLAARALDVPVACRAMCAPIDALDRKCDAPDGPNERADETKCICADTAVVRTIFPLCMDCIRQNPPAANRGDDDDAEDAREAQAFLSRCGAVSSTQFTPGATSVIQNLGASGTPQPTRAGGSTQPTGGAGGSGTGSGTGSSGSSGNGSPAATATGSRTSASPQRNGASGAQPLAGVSAAGALYVAGALVAGGVWALG